MYRARADAVSGTRIYADGKWLRCIGNKNVSVGEYIWTDGRCVYGHLQESQQPKVITAQEDEGIPIILQANFAAFGLIQAWTLFTFEKNRLKRVAAIYLENDNKIHFYKDVAGELEFVETMPNTDKWTNFSLMINDDKKTAFLYDAGTHFKRKFYSSTGLSEDDAKHFYSDTELIASNVDKSGKRFDMVIRYKSEWETNDTGSRQIKSVKETAVEILQDGNIVKSIDFQGFIAEVENNCPDAEPIHSLAYANAYATYISYNLSGAFIDDDQRWCFWLLVRCKKETNYFGENIPEEDYPRAFFISDFDNNSLERLYLITQDGHSIVSESSGRWVELQDERTGSLYKEATELTKTSNPATFPIQDGYYCTARDFFEQDGAEDYIDVKSFAHVTFYSPNGKEIFTGIFSLPQTFTFCRVKGKYLLGVEYSALFAGYDTPQIYDSVRVFNSGLFLGAGTQWKNLIAEIGTSGHILNQRLRPMKKFRGWQNRTQLIELDQQEI